MFYDDLKKQKKQDWVWLWDKDKTIKSMHQKEIISKNE